MISPLFIIPKLLRDFSQCILRKKVLKISNLVVPHLRSESFSNKLKFIRWEIHFKSFNHLHFLVGNHCLHDSYV